MKTNTAIPFLMAGIVMVAPRGARAVEQIRVPIEVSGNELRLVRNDLGLPISLNAPEIAFLDGGAAGPSERSHITGDFETGGTLTVEYPPADLGGGAFLERTLYLEWSPDEQVLRKWGRMRLTGSTESWTVAGVTLDRFPAEQVEFLPAPPQSYPAFLNGFFVGIEFPVATTRVEDGALIVSHAPGLHMESGTWYETRKAVYGVAPSGEEKEAFQRYIARRRPAPHDLHVNYNSWWTSSVPFTEAEILDLIGQFKRDLFDAHGVAPDTFCIDMGWSDDKSIWQISKERFPDGFANLKTALETMRSHLGLWISPTAFYGQALDPEWARVNGYETMPVANWAGSPIRICCLGGPRYAAAFREQLVRLVSENDIRHVKLDGYMLTCNETDHGHEPGALSAEACAEGGIAAFEAVRKAVPEVWLETTCFGWNPSPWWLLFVNSVIGTYGDDSPHGRVPAPVYWESKITARDYFNLQGASLLPIPDSAQEVLGLIVQTDDPWLNEGVVVAARGHMFMPLYVNPRFMNERRWAQLAGLLTWARANAGILGYATTPLLPASWRDGRQPRFNNDAVMPREPYGYAHWKGDAGLVLLRNPWIERASYTVYLAAETGQPLQAVSVYPEARVYAKDVASGSTLDVILAPYETIALHIAPALRTEGLPHAASATEGLLTCDNVAVNAVREEYAGDEQRALGPDWTNLSSGIEQAARVALSARVTTAAPRTELLVLLEGTETPSVAEASLAVDGLTAELEAGPSDAGWAASSIPAGAEHWMFLRAPVAQGSHEVRLEVVPEGAASRVSVWLWGHRAGVDSDYPNALPAPEIVSLDALPLMPVTDVSSIERVETRPARIERIDGIYLDALTPVSAAQGWGELQLNRSVTGKPLRIAGQTYRRGLGTHAVSRLTYNIGEGDWRTLDAWAGIDSGGTGTVRFRVLLDGEERWDSGVMRAQQKAAHVRVDVTGAKTLELVADDAGDGIGSDHADWTNAKLLR